MEKWVWSLAYTRTRSRSPPRGAPGVPRSLASHTSRARVIAMMLAMTPPRGQHPPAVLTEPDEVAEPPGDLFLDEGADRSCVPDVDPLMDPLRQHLAGDRHRQRRRREVAERARMLGVVGVRRHPRSELGQDLVRGRRGHRRRRPADGWARRRSRGPPGRPGRARAAPSHGRRASRGPLARWPPRALPARGANGRDRGCRAGRVRGSNRSDPTMAARVTAACSGPPVTTVTDHRAPPAYGARMYGRVLGVTVLGVGGHLVTVEAHVGRGLPSLTLTGLPGAAVRDATDRIRPAVEGAGLEWPLRRVVVNLAPGNLRKEGPGLDLPVAMGVLAATAQVPSTFLARYAFAGELSLKGELMPTPGVLSVAIEAARKGLEGVIVPAPNAREAAQVEGLHVVSAASLADVVGFLRGTWTPDEPPPPVGDDAAAGTSVDLRGRPWPTASSARPRGCRRRRPQRPARRFARRGQDDAGPAHDDDPPAPQPRGGARGDAAPLGGGPARRWGRRAARPPVPRAASLRLPGRAPGRRRHLPAARRGLAGPPWRPVPR